MRRIYLFIFILISCTSLFAQKRIGLTASYDLAFNSADKLMQPSLGRKFTIGLAFGDLNKKAIGFLAAGFKGFKVNMYSPQFQSKFLDEVNSTYHLVENSEHDSLVGVSLFRLTNKEQGFFMTGTYSLHLQGGFIWNNSRFRPLLMFYAGTEKFVFRTPLFFNYQNYQEYISMNSVFYEIKAGIGLPVLRDKPWSVNLNAGYRHIDYRQISFDGTPLSVYTDGAIAEKYSKNDKLTVSVSIIWWSNWNVPKVASAREL